MTTPFTRADEADRIYEGFLFAQVIATAAECEGRVTYEDCYEKEVQDLVLLGAPGVPRDEALKYVGMRRSFPPSMASLFVTNTFSTHANKCVSHAKRLPFEFGAMPGTRFQTYVRAHIREVFKGWVAGFDFGHQV